MFAKATFALSFLLFFIGKREHLLYRCITSYDRYEQNSSSNDSLPFADTSLDTLRSTDKHSYHYEQFRVYCDSLIREGDRYFWGVQVKSCTYMSRQARFHLGTSPDEQPYDLGERVAQSHCRLTTFGEMLPIPPSTKVVWLRVEDLDFARVRE